MSKDVKRDKNGRFAKKDVMAEELKYAKAYCKFLESVIDSRDKALHNMEQQLIEEQAKYYKLKKEFDKNDECWRMDWKYLKGQRDSYMRAYNKAKAIAKDWKGKCEEAMHYANLYEDIIGETISQVEWLYSKMPWYKRLFYRKTVHEMAECLHAYSKELE